jgi:hypothetical protein
MRLLLKHRKYPVTRLRLRSSDLLTSSCVRSSKQLVSSSSISLWTRLRNSRLFPLGKLAGGSVVIKLYDKSTKKKVPVHYKIELLTQCCDPGCFIPDPGSDHFLLPDTDPTIFSSRIRIRPFSHPGFGSEQFHPGSWILHEM